METYMSNQPNGLYGKFNVTRTDGRDQPGGDRADAEHFVLDLVHDQFSAVALLAYAEACQHEYPDLSRQLIGIAFRSVPVIRDENGFFQHPVTLLLDEGTDIKAWAERYGITWSVVEFEFDAPENLVDQYFETGSPDCSAWNPTPPEGNGWVLANINDTDDGPVAHFFRRQEQTA